MAPRNEDCLTDEVVDATGVVSQKVRCLRGTIQRLHYQRRELTIIADGAIWHFVVPCVCPMWFNEAPANLRCFHPLDPVTVILDANQDVKAIYSWQSRALAA